MPRQRPAYNPTLTRPYIPVQPTELTCTCTTYAGEKILCIRCSIDKHFFSPYPTLSTSSGPVIKRKNFKVPNPLQGKMV